jgi:hypothetical protein
MATDYVAVKPTKLWKGSPFVKLDNGDWVLQADKTVPVGTILSLGDPDNYAFNFDGKKASFRYVTNMDSGSSQFYIQTSVVDALLDKAQSGSLQEPKNYWPKSSSFTVTDQPVGGKKRKVKVTDPSAPLSARKVYGEPIAYAGGLTPPGYIFLPEFTTTKPTKPTKAEPEQKPKKPSGGGSYTPPPSLPAPAPAEPQEAGPNKLLIIAGVAGAVVLLLLLTGSKD